MKIIVFGQELPLLVYYIDRCGWPPWERNIILDRYNIPSHHIGVVLRNIQLVLPTALATCDKRVAPVINL